MHEPATPRPVFQESTRHAEALDAVTTFLGYGSYLEWSEDKRIEWLTKELEVGWGRGKNGEGGESPSVRLYVDKWGPRSSRGVLKSSTLAGVGVLGGWVEVAVTLHLGEYVCVGSRHVLSALRVRADRSPDRGGVRPCAGSQQ